MTDIADRRPTPEQMYIAGVPHYKLELVCHPHKRALRFSTPEEYAALLPKTGRPRWRGTMAITQDQLGRAYCPPIDERLTEGPAFDQALDRVLTEGYPVDVV